MKSQGKIFNAFLVMSRLVLLSVVASCGDEPFVGNVDDSQFFEYHNQVQEPLCPTLLSRLDQHAQMIGDKIGLTLDTDDPYRYYKFRDAAAFAEDSGGCHPENGACALGDAVYSTTYFHAHEQAHDYVFRAWSGWSNDLLVEGEAVALSCIPFYELEPGQKPVDVVGSLDWRGLMKLNGDSSEGYGAAGFFITYLAEQYGWQSVERLHRKVPRNSGVDDLEQAFAEVYPMSIDQVWADALGTAGASPCQKDWQCLSTSMAVGEIAIPDCDGEMHRNVDVDKQGGVVLSVEGDDTQLMLLPCGVSAPTSYTLKGGHAGRPATHWASLPPGSYAMFPRLSPLPTSVAFQSYFRGPLVSSICDSTNPISLDRNGRTSIDLLPGGIDGWVRLEGGDQTYDVFPYDLVWNDLLTAGPVAICDDCSGVSCTPIPYGKVTRVLISNQSVVRFRNVLSFPSPSAWGQIVFDVTPTN